jgi:hypothetical protein
MNPFADHLDQARQVADAVLYEGYLLYPYRQSARQNRSRFQFGVLMPPGYRSVDPSEPSASQTECLLECADDAQVLVGVRFLQAQRRRVLQHLPAAGRLREVASLTVDGVEYTAWDEAVEREQEVRAEVGELLSGELGSTVHVEAVESGQDIVVASTGRVAGRLARSSAVIDGVIRLRAEPAAGPYGAIKLSIRIENHSLPATPPGTRQEALACALIAAHAMIWVPGGRFVSMTEPPEWAAEAVAGCENIGTWPVLAGPPDRRDLMLSSPVILYDHAEVAPESAGDMFDATEIDEILTLRTLALTDAEKQAARATDPRAADLLDRLEAMPPQAIARLHGTIRYRTPDHTATAEPEAAPERTEVLIGGVPVRRGSRVRMRPGIRRADAQDLFLAGRQATVQSVLTDLDGNVHVAVTPDRDEAADLQRSRGRYLYFSPEELEPIQADPADAAGPTC